jgi:hypothetical protein
MGAAEPVSEPGRRLGREQIPVIEMISVKRSGLTIWKITSLKERRPRGLPQATKRAAPAGSAAKRCRSGYSPSRSTGDQMSDRTMLLEHLAQAERHVAEGERDIARQREIIAELERDGRDTTLARALLEQFEEVELLHIEGRDRLRKELEDDSG